MTAVRQWFRKILRRQTVLAVVVSLLAALAITSPLWFVDPHDSSSWAERARNIALIVAGIVAFAFALVRVHIAEKEHYYRRFQEASELLASDSSQARVSGLHAFRYLVFDDPRMGLVVFEVVIAFILQAAHQPPDNLWKTREVELAFRTANMVSDAMFKGGEVDAIGLDRLERDLAFAMQQVARPATDHSSPECGR